MEVAEAAPASSRLLLPPLLPLLRVGEEAGENSRKKLLPLLLPPSFSFRSFMDLLGVVQRLRDRPRSRLALRLLPWLRLAPIPGTDRYPFFPSSSADMSMPPPLNSLASASSLTSLALWAGIGTGTSIIIRASNQSMATEVHLDCLRACLEYLVYTQSNIVEEWI